MFFDDILIYIEEQFLLHCSKCVFVKNQLHYLGHIVSANDVATNLSEIQAMLD